MSLLSKALTALGYTGASDNQTQAAQSACVDNLYLAGYLGRENIWTVLHQMGGPFGENALSPAEAFAAIDPILDAAGAYQDNPEEFFADDIISKLLDDGNFDNEDAVDLVTYLQQTAFGRAVGQERNELQNQSWMETHKDRFMQNAEALGVINETRPERQNFDYSFLMGAARLRAQTRTQDLKNQAEDGLEPGVVKVLAGQRELNAELDGLGPEAEVKKQDGITYIFNLAAKHDIQPNPQQAFIERNGRTFFNYADNQQQRVTETLMMNDQVETILGDTDIEYILVDTQSDENGRPTTKTTSDDALKSIIEGLGETPQQDIHVLVQSNQPYVERQRLVVERSFRDLKEEFGLDGVNFVFHGTGEANELGAVGVNSALGALSGERYSALTRDDDGRKRDASSLMFQTREKETDHIPPLPQTLPPEPRRGYRPSPP
jgi:hypothetical protein